ncbi:MAG: hypothetical protein ACOYY2_13105 [Actinomycetota bacterium]
MRLNRTGAEYGTWTLSADVDLDGTVEVAFLPRGTEPDATTTWVTAAWSAPQTGVPPQVSRAARLLLVGPETAPVPLGGHVLAVGEHVSWVRLTDTPEVVIRQGEAVTVR